MMISSSLRRASAKRQEKRDETKVQSPPPDRRPNWSAKLPRVKRRPKKPQSTSYVISIERWEWNYSFGINDWEPHLHAGYYADYRHLQVHGALVRPSEVSDVAVQLNFLTTEISSERSPYRKDPTDIGPMWKRRGAGIEAYLLMPTDILPTLLPMLVAEKLRYVVLHGAPMFRGGTQIQRFQFAELAPEDFP